MVFINLRVLMKEKSEVEIQDRVSVFYEEERYRKPYSRFYQDWWTRKMLEFVSIKGSILDNGCGTGILGEVLSRSEGQIFGIDISHNMLNYAKNRITRLTLGDSHALPFKKGAFDLVVARSLVHHLHDPQRGIEEMARVLREGGQMVLADTNSSIISCLPRLIAKRGEHFSEDHKNMSCSYLTALLKQFFRIDRIFYFGYLAYPIGFPDILDIGKYCPFPMSFTKMLVKIDEIIARIPLIRTQSWGVVIKATKLGGQHD